MSNWWFQHLTTVLWVPCLESGVVRCILLLDDFDGWFLDTPYNLVFAEDVEVWFPPEEWLILSTEDFENGGW